MTEKVSFPSSRFIRLLQFVTDKIRKHSVELSLFLCLWFIYGLAINSRNQFAFNLQQAGVEAIVERHHFYLEGSAAPRLQMKVYYYDGNKPFGDVFEHQDHQYAAKQPGQFMAGAMAYFFLHLLGLDYVRHYALTSALVSFLTTSLVTALAAIAVFATVRRLRGDGKLFWPLVCALSFGLGTTAFVYSGVAYHDALAAGYLAIAFYFALVLGQGRANQRSAKLLAASCGVLLGLTVTTSMLPFFMTCIIALYVIWLRQWKLTTFLLLGGLAGIAPLLFYNSASFGSPLLNSYMAGGYPESMLQLNLANSIEKVRLYLSEISLYVPVVWLGLLGLAFFPARFRREQLLILLLFVVHAFQVLNIESHGGCHYGPRFLLPIMPFIAVSLCGFGYFKTSPARALTIVVLILLGITSIFISALGALYTAMFCDTGKYALWPAIQSLRTSSVTDFPLAVWLALPLAASAILLSYSIRNYRTAVTDFTPS